MAATVSASIPFASGLGWSFSLALSVFVAAAFGWMNHALFENRLWFSNIEQVEREISFRTEAGLYYSYYKQLTESTVHHSNRSIFQAIVELTDDYRTEAPRSINVIQRFNIFQEIILALAYQALQSVNSIIIQSPFLSKLISPYLMAQLTNPIFVYVYACFLFAALGAFTLFWLTCALTARRQYGNIWCAYKELPMGLLAVAWLFANLEDATRVNFTLNLREIFALPIFWLQNYFIICAFDRGYCVYGSKSSNNSVLNHVCIIISTLTFSALWQMNQFLLMLQSAALFAVVISFSSRDNYGITNTETTVRNILCSQTLGFILLIPLQGFQPMLLTSIFVQLNAAILLSLFIFPSSQTAVNEKASETTTKYESAKSYNNSKTTNVYKTPANGKIPVSVWDFLSKPQKADYKREAPLRLPLFRIFVVSLSIFIFSLIRKIIFNIHTDDSHIWTFAIAKFRLLLINPFSAEFPVEDLALLPFETAIYICHGAFSFIDVGFFERTSKSGLFPLYLSGIFVILFYSIRLTFYDKLQECSDINDNHKKIVANGVSPNGSSSTNSNPDTNKIFSISDHSENDMTPALLYFASQSALSGLLACLMLRMKFLWLPQMAVVAAYTTRILLDKTVGKTIRNLVIVAAAGALFAKRYDSFRAEIANEQEFYDPDTVALMQWISRETHRDAIFAGSMQLMAGVKCCTNRRIANHPHFEDKWLRDRTQTLYQIYARRTPNEVHEILTNEKVDYIIVEESICLLPPNGCTTTELMDFANRHVPPLPNKSKAHQAHIVGRLQSAGFKSTQISRFCTKVREFGKQSANLFKLVFQNPTFRVYRIIY